MDEPSGYADEDVRKLLSQLDIEQLCRVVNMEMHCRYNREGDMQRMLEYITSKIQLLVLYQKYIRSYDMMRKVEEQAQRDQDVFWGYFGRTFTTSALNTPAFYSCLQAGEYSGQDGAKTYRVLVQLRLAFEVFEGAGANDFCERGTACYYVDTERSTGPMVRVQLGGGRTG